MDWIQSEIFICKTWNWSLTSKYGHVNKKLKFCQESRVNGQSKYKNMPCQKHVQPIDNKCQLDITSLIAFQVQTIDRKFA